MNGPMRIGGVLLALFGGTCAAGAQEAAWRPAARPADFPIPDGPVAPIEPPASLGRPVAVHAAPPPALTPVPRPVRSDPNFVTTAYHEPAAPTPVPRGGPIATELPDAVDGGFASDRAVRPALYPTEPITVPPQPGPAATDLNPFPPAPPAPPEYIPGNAAGCDMAYEDSDGLFPGLAALMPRFYARGEYLLWWFKDDQVPPLVTTSAPADAGFLNGRTTQVLFGGDGLSSGSHSGGRFTAGLWLDDCQEKALEVSGFFLPGGTRRFEANSALFPVLARPFFSLNRNGEFVELTAFPGISTGNVAVQNSSSLWGVEANLRCCLCSGCPCCDEDECNPCPCDDPGWSYHVTGLVGPRYLNLHEDLQITEDVVNLPTAPTNPNKHFLLVDDFATRNQFYGGQVGLDAEINRGPWSLEVLGKLALGDTHQQIDINGTQRVTNLITGVMEPPTVGGLLALRSNIGTHTRDAFSVVPEINLNLSYHINEHWRLIAGYDFLYWTNVVRPGQQIDRVLDETLIPNFMTNPPVGPAGQNRPAVPFRQSDFWAQGINLGLEFRY